MFPGDRGIPSTLAPRQELFSPRIGLAYAPAVRSGMLSRLLGGPGKFSLRAGYGLFYTTIEGLSAGLMSANITYGYSYTSSAPPLFDRPFVTASTGAVHPQPFPLPFPPLNVTAKNPDSNVDFSRYLPDPFGPGYDPHNVTPYFNTALFSVPPLGSYGTSPRRFFDGPGQEDFDIALLKVTHLGRHKNLELRLETFNTFNHSQFFGAGSVNGIIGTPGFGSVVNAESPRLTQVAARFSF